MVSLPTSASPSDKLALLNQALAQLIERRGGQHEIVEGLVYVGRIVGFTRQGMTAIGEFTNLIRKTRADMRRGSTAPVQAKALAHILIAAWKDRLGSSATHSDLTAIEEAHSQWFAEQQKARTHVVPCDIVSQPASAFFVGPVRFMLLQGFLDRENRAGHAPEIFSSLIECANQSGVYWVAEVTVEGCEAKRSAEIADLTVDLALCGLQLVVPTGHSRRMARATARRLGPFSGSAVFEGKSISGGVSVTRAAPTLAGQTLDIWLGAQRTQLDAIGRRIDVFLTGTATLSVLDQAWCDAAYWLHEGLAETLDTIAVAKLETAIEVLMRSEKSSGSAGRLEKALDAFFGLSPNDVLKGSGATVKAFVKDIVGARSQVLHGTFSTLTQDSRATREDAEGLAVPLLREFAVALNEYAASSAPKDDIASFLVWVAARRLAREADA